MFVFVRLSCYFLESLWITAGEGADLLAPLDVTCSCVYVTDEVWYLIESIPDLFLLYFV